MNMLFLLPGLVDSLAPFAPAMTRRRNSDSLLEVGSRMKPLERFDWKTGFGQLANLGPSLHRVLCSSAKLSAKSQIAARLLMLVAFLGSVVPCNLAHASQVYEPGQAFRDCSKVCPEMIVVPPGTYLMGSPPDDSHQAKDDVEQPQHRVTIRRPFAVGKFEVTRDEYAHFARETRLIDPDGCNVHEPPNWPTKMGLNWHTTPFPQTGRDPAVCINWEEAQAYTEWLSKKTGHTYRLLSEAEWEYVARAGTTTEAFWGDDERRDCEYANGVDLTLLERFPKIEWETSEPHNPNPGRVVPCHDGHVFTSPVGSYKPNAFGLYDTIGNVAEWTADCLVKNYAGAPTDGSARTDGDCSRRVNRGPAWDSNPTGLRSAYRGWDKASTRAVDLGLRVARDL